MDTILGQKLLILNANGTAAVAMSKSCEIDITCQTVETASFNSRQCREYIPGLHTWQVRTDYLVTSPLAHAAQVGRIVTLRAWVEPQTAYPFDEYVSSVAGIRPQYDGTPDKIVYSAEQQAFYGLVGGPIYLVYASWRDMEQYHASVMQGAWYRDAAGDYYYGSDDGQLVPAGSAPRIGGRAIVSRCNISARWGSLCQGSFTFRGTGPYIQLA